MIKARFMRGSSYIDIKIEGRILTFITPLLNFQPVKIDLDKLNEQKDKLEKMKLDEKIMKKLSELQTEKDMLQDIKEDLHKSGWRIRNDSH